MKIRLKTRVAAVTLLSAASLVAADGCTTVKKVSSPQPGASDETTKKEYQWQDMSTGKSFFRPINQAPKD